MAQTVRPERRDEDTRTRRTGPFSRLARSLAATTALLAAAVLVGAAAAGSTYALWKDSVTAPAQTVRTGAIELRSDGVTELTVAGLDVVGLYPGGAVTRPSPVVVTNQGTVPLDVSWTGTTMAGANAALNSALIPSLRTAPNAGPTACTTSAPGSALPSTLSFRLAPGASTALCVEIRLPASAPATARAASAQATYTLDATQVRP